MAVVQIPNLPAVANIGASALFETVQAGVSYKVNLQQIAAYVASSVSPFIIPTGYVTTYQFMNAVATITGNPNALYLALPTGFTDPVTIQFFNSAFVAVGSPLYNLCQSVYGYTDIQMQNLMAQAATVQPWG